MLCRKPYVSREGLPFGCGQCLPCRISRRRVWVHRILLEMKDHLESSFVTLTYADEHLPEGAQLVPKHTQDWLKRLRKAAGGQRLRFFLVGEYGEKGGRPHYHVALFGLGPSSRKLIEESWSLGHVLIGTLTNASATYVAQYVTKKMTSKEDVRLCGKHPEFARMSRRKGIGFNSVAPVATVLNRLRVSSPELGTVPLVLLHGSRALPLGRYLRSKIREVVYGDNAEAIKEFELVAYQKEMQELLRVEIAKSDNASSSTSQMISRRDHQKVLTCESWNAIKVQRRTL